MITEPVETTSGTVIAEGVETVLGTTDLDHLQFIVHTLREHLTRKSCRHAGAIAFCPTAACASDNRSETAAGPSRSSCEAGGMAQRFSVGDHVGWNSEAGQVTGVIVKVHTSDTTYKGHVRHCTKDDPQYEIMSDKTDHIAMHKGAALHQID